MTGALIILIFVITVGIILYASELRWRRKHPVLNDVTPESKETATSKEPAGSEESAGSEVCCGLHLVCEKDSLSPMSDEIIYYDDEELDRFIGRAADSYSPEETEEFRDVLMTLLPGDVAGWARSVTRRHLELPPEVRDELLMLVNEQRNSR